MARLAKCSRTCGDGEVCARRRHASACFRHSLVLPIGDLLITTPFCHEAVCRRLPFNAGMGPAFPGPASAGRYFFSSAAVNDRSSDRRCVMSRASARSRSEPLASSTPRASSCRTKCSNRSEASASRKVKCLCFMSSRMIECEYRAVLAPLVSRNNYIL